MLSDETYINERIGQRNKAQLSIKNPQIINGGQTAFTLSRIYEEQHSDRSESTIFEGKEVLLKVITLLRPSSVGGSDERRKIQLIDQISTATNQQTAVNQADRLSNESIFLEVQQVLFDRYGLLFERKRGEFEDGIRAKYIDKYKVIERNLFFRIYYASNGNIPMALQRKLFVKSKDQQKLIEDTEKLDRFYFAYLAFMEMAAYSKQLTRNAKGPTLGKLYFITEKYIGTAHPGSVGWCVNDARPIWDNLLEFAMSRNEHHFGIATDKITGTRRKYFKQNKWIESVEFLKDVKEFLTTAT